MIGQIGLIAASYLAGSMPWGYWIVRVIRHVDIRTLSSGNTGATNVWRAFGPRLGVPTFLLDVGKGFGPALAGLIISGPTLAVIAGAAAMVGHTFPIFLGLGGGKGVATGAGVMLAVFPVGWLFAGVLWITLLWLFRYVSLASMGGAFAFASSSLLLDNPLPVTVFATVAGLVVVARHRTNIGRLRLGTEPRVMSFGRGRT